MTKTFKEKMDASPSMGNYKRLLEMPIMIPSGVVNYSNLEDNRDVLAGLLKDVTGCLQNLTTHALYIAGTNTDGVVFVHNKIQNTMDYCLSFNKTKEFVGEGIVLKEVWNNRNSPYTKDATNLAVFDFLLKVNKCIFSDATFTPEGKTWWINLMKKAASRVLSVSLYAISTDVHEVSKRPRNEPVEVWLRNHDVFWGEHEQSINVKFVIVHGTLE